MPGRVKRRDPIELQIELALGPGVFIRDRACYSFVSSLEGVVAEINALLASDAARAAVLYETFLAGCREKAEELDDSSGSFNMFAKGMICRWVKARQQSGSDADETAATLLAWMDDDPYAFCYEVEGQLSEALDGRGQEAFDRVIRARYEATPATEGYDRRRWSGVLRAIYLARRDATAYHNLAEQSGLTPKDCFALATMVRSRKPALALDWVERGIQLDGTAPFGYRAGYELGQLRLELLAKLGRQDEAIEIAWAEFREHPSNCGFDDLMKMVPKAQRAAWREKALDAAQGADLHSVMDLLTETKESERLAELVRGVTDVDLENISHYATEAAGVMLDKSHPELAARLWCAQAFRIVDAGKSKYYDIALRNLDRARRCWLRAGGEREWAATVRQIRAEHFRKRGFMSAFERMAGGEKAESPPSFLERAKDRWGVNRRGRRS
jgi:uncharacterized Zn finger protein